MIIEDYIKLLKEERQKHLDLESPCILRGGNSTQHRGILVQYLDTTFPKGRILLCHACGNGECSNPVHLYWGTDKENIVEDGKKFGTFENPWKRMVEKYGYEGACKINSRGDKSKGGKANTNPKSEEHKRKISEGVRRRNLQ